jgi:hypothetical protein
MKARPYFFSGPYFPKPEDNRMESVGDTVILRRDFLEHKPAKLDHLFKLRFGWMNEHLNAGERGLEIGCGAAFTQLYLRTDVKIWHSDVFYQDWLSTVLDGLTLPFANQSLDFILPIQLFFLTR